MTPGLQARFTGLLRLSDSTGLFEHLGASAPEVAP
jgi:hypothetical protein